MSARNSAATVFWSFWAWVNKAVSADLVDGPPSMFASMPYGARAKHRQDFRKRRAIASGIMAVLLSLGARTLVTAAGFCRHLTEARAAMGRPGITDRR